MKFVDYYKVLGLERTATLDEIKQAYRKLAHQYHPDVSKDPQGEEKFKEIAEAYATLKDPVKRAEYDKLGNLHSGEEFVPPHNWQEAYNQGGATFSDVDLADIIASFTSRQRGAHHQRAHRGQDFEIPVSINLDQVMQGAEIELNVTLPEYDEQGLIHRVPQTIKVRIPKGARDGQRLRLPEKGGKGFHGAKSGDLYLALSVTPHPLYRVKGKDLSLDLPLTPWEAVLGAKVNVPTLNGTVKLNIPAGTTAGQQLRLAKQGLPAPDGSIGDLFAIIQIQVPKSASEEDKKLFQQLANESTFNPRAHFVAGGHA